ncbi:MAG: molybdopterin-guanine dinucleotide biosynthesis protein B [Methylosarcina sp.]
MKNVHVPILGFAAASGTGKTTLLEQLIPILRQHGLRVGLIKHSHHSFDIDHPGKDSFRLREAGANPVMLVSRKRRAVITEFDSQDEPRLDEQLEAFEQNGLDLILVEGFKSEPIPKIELHRIALKKPLLYPGDPNIIAIASDCPLTLPNPLVQLDINQPNQIAEFILKWIVSRK